MMKLQRKLLGWIDKIIISYYMGAILIRFSEIEMWILSGLCQDIFTGGNAEFQSAFNQQIETLEMGKKISYLKGNVNGNLYTNESLYRIKIANEFQEYKDLLELLNQVKEERNPFVHTKYFIGYASEVDNRLSFNGIYIDRKVKTHNVDLTPKKMREKSKYLDDIYLKLRKLYDQLQIELFLNVNTLDTLKSESENKQISQDKLE